MPWQKPHRRLNAVVAGFVFALAVLCCVALPLRDALALSVIRDQEIEDVLCDYSKGIFESAGLSPESVQFIIVQDDSLNAFVAGGQNIFFHTGLILAAETPQELLGVIAHETGHIASGHLFRLQESIEDISMQAMLANVLGMAVAIGAKSSDAGAATLSAGQTLAQRLILRHTRGQESSADQSGVRFLQEAGLPVDGFLSFMEKLSAQELLPESQQSQYVRTHPLTRDRIDFLRNAVTQEKSAGQLPAGWPERHARIRAKLLGYLYPTRALLDKSDSVSARYGRAIALYRQGRVDNAIALLDGLLAQEKDNPFFNEVKAQILMESGRVDESLPFYARAVTLAPHSGLIRAAYGHALLEARASNDKKRRAENRAEAIQQLSRALRIEPRMAGAFRQLAIAHGQNGEEGLSRLYLAEEAVLRGKADIARREAGLARAALPKDSPGWLRANDILDMIGKSKPARGDRKK